MVNKCIICDDPAEYKIKDSLDYYCKECAEEHFSDTSILLKVEEEAKRLQKFLSEKIDPIKLNDKTELGEEKDEEEIHELLDTSESQNSLNSVMLENEHSQTEEGEINNKSSNEEE